MSTTTPNLGLTKPATTETADIAVINANSDKIDGHRHLGGPTDGQPVKAVQSGPVASRPADVTAGQLYVATDKPGLSFANGASWFGVPVSTQNLLANGGFEVWQRGTGAFTTSGVYTADGWGMAVGGTGAALSVSKNTAVLAPMSTASLQSVYTHGGNEAYIQQVIKELGPILAGQTIAFSMMVWCNTPNAARLQLWDWVTDYAGSVSLSHPGDSAWHKLTVVRPVRAGVTQILARLHLSASCTAYADNAMLVLGEGPVDYMPLPPAEEWARCQRYFRGGRIDTGSLYGHAGWWLWSSATFARMAVPPTRVVTPGGLAILNSTTGANDTANWQLNGGYSSEDSVVFQFLRTSALGGPFALTVCWTAEANP